MILFLFYVGGLASVAVLLFWAIQKVLELVDYRSEMKLRRLRNEALECEIQTRESIAAFYRARTWSEIRKTKRGAQFTDDELRRIEELGLSSYLETENDVQTEN